MSHSLAPNLALKRRDLLGGLAVAVTSSAWPGPAGAATPTAVPLRLQPFGMQRSRLDNGLQILALPMEGTQSVAVQMWFGVGGRDDPVGRSGFAHLFEHLMFKGTQHMAAETFDRLTEDVGGYNNAFTAEDVTAYQALVPGNHLERVLWAEGERLASLKLGPEEFESERSVVIEEYRERVLASPYGKLFNALPGEAFAVHPYRRPVIGNMDDLAAATLDDVKQFHRTFYRPDNAVLVVAGAFEPAQLGRWAQDYLGRVAAPSTPLARSQTTEPRRARASRRALLGPQVPLPAVAILWPGPTARHSDAKALQVAAALLSGGESSRLHQALVYRDRQAQQAGFSADLYAQAGMLVGWGIQAGTGTLAKLEEGLRREIAQLAHRPIDRQELDKVRRQLLTQALINRQTPEGLAEAVGWAHTLLGDGAEAERELARLSAVRPQDVQAALRRHVMQTPAITVTYRQAPVRPGDQATGRATP